MACMVTHGVPAYAAVQTVVAALMKVLADGMGTAGAAAHLRLMANEMEAGAPAKH